MTGSYSKIRERAIAAETRAAELERELATCRKRKEVEYRVEPNTTWTYDDLEAAKKKRDQLLGLGCDFAKISVLKPEDK